MSYGHHNNRHIPIPCSDQNNVYIGRACCKFNKHSFDESLVINKLSRQEFEQVVDTVHEKVNNFRNYWWITLWATLGIAISVTVFVVCLVMFSGDEDTHNNDYYYSGDSYAQQDSYETSNGWGIAIGIIVYIGGLLLSIFCMIWRMIVYTNKCQRKIQHYFDEINLHTYHPRNIHWTVGDKLRFIHIMLDFHSPVIQGLPIQQNYPQPQQQYVQAQAFPLQTQGQIV